MSGARDMFRLSLNVLDDMRRRGILDANDEQWAKEIAGELAKCDTILGAQPSSAALPPGLSTGK